MAFGKKKNSEATATSAQPAMNSISIVTPPTPWLPIVRAAGGTGSCPPIIVTNVMAQTATNRMRR